MTLQVPFEGFAKAARSVAGAKEVYLTGHPAGVVATCANTTKGIHIVSVSRLKPEEATEQLKNEGLEVENGIWTEQENIRLEADPVTTAFVAAVSYQSSEHVPGVWVDAYPDQPNHVQVLRAMYEEFRQSGELADVTFEEFIRLSNPNVVVVSSTEIRGYLEAKANPCP